MQTTGFIAIFIVIDFQWLVAILKNDFFQVLTFKKCRPVYICDMRRDIYRSQLGATFKYIIIYFL